MAPLIVIVTVTVIVCGQAGEGERERPTYPHILSGAGSRWPSFSIRPPPREPALSPSAASTKKTAFPKSSGEVGVGA